MEYIGHSKVYYQGSNGYKVCCSDDGIFYSVYFDAFLPPIRILHGRKNVLNLSSFKYALDMDEKKQLINFNPDLFISYLISDLKLNFGLEIDIII